MNDNVGEETILSALFPLPYRALALAGLGILAWATNLHGLQLSGIDAVAALDLHSYPSRATLSSRSASSLPVVSTGGWRHISAVDAPYAPVYKLFLQYSAIVTLSWLIYRNVTHGNLALADVFRYIPAVTALIVLILLISPFNILEKHERDRFFSSLYRCVFSSRSKRIYFSDVVFADILTSFARVIGDAWLSLHMLLPGGSVLLLPSQDGWSRWILPTLMSLPYALRFRQCIIEYRLSTNQSRRPLYNAVKYATSFPVMYLSAAQRTIATDIKGPSIDTGAWHGEHRLFRLWLLAAAVNSLYSFWWDVTHDWGLDLLRPHVSPANPRNQSKSPLKSLVLPHLHSHPGHRTSVDGELKEDLLVDSSPSKHGHSRYPWGLRPILLFPLPIYPFAVLADLVLRLTWSAKLSSHLHSYAEGHLIIFWIEMAEILRRWMWVFIRVEWEVVKNSHGVQHRFETPPYSTSRHVLFSADASAEDYEMLPSVRDESMSEMVDR